MFKECTKLSVDTQKIRLTVKKTEKENIKVEYNKGDYICEELEDTLVITQKSSDVKDEEVIIYIPDKMIAENITISSNIGYVKLWDLAAKEIKISLSMGHVGIDSVKADNLEVYVSAGDLKAKNVSLKSSWLSLSNGLLKIKKLSVQEKLNAQVCDGTLKLALEENTAENCRLLGIIENGLRQIDEDISKSDGDVLLNLKVVNGRLRVKRE